MKLPELDASANYPIKSCPEGFEAKALLKAWSQQLTGLLHSPGANLAEINTCINRLVDIAHQATEYSRPEEYNNDTQENEAECP